MRRSIALLGMATAMMATCATTIPSVNPHELGETLSYSGGSSHQSKYKRDRMDPIKAQQLAKRKRRAARNARRNNRRK